MTKRCSAVAAWVLGGTIMALTTGPGLAQDLPVVKGRKVVASIQGEWITLDELNRQVAAVRREEKTGPPLDRRAELALLDRLINTMLITQEARRMDLDKLPDIRRMVDSYAGLALRNALVSHALKGTKPDPEQVRKIYQPVVREWKISAVFFPREEPARSMAADLAAGRSFEERARASLAAGQATRVQDAAFLREQALEPAVREALAGLTPGSTSAVIRLPDQFAIVQVQDVRYPDDPAERAKAERIVRGEARSAAIRTLDETLRKRYAKIHQDVLARVDFDSPAPGIDALRKDRRVLVEVKGEKPLTVGDLAEAFRHKFYHGVQRAVEEKRLNAQKDQVLGELLQRRLFRKEALRLGLDKSEGYRSDVKEFEHSLLFGTFLRKVIAPGIKIEESELRAYYAEHRAEYTTPEMLRIKSLAFVDRRSAESALESLHKGADFQWVARQAEGQAAPSAKGVLSFGDKPIATGELPAGVQKAVAAAKAGDARLYAGSEGYFYTLLVEGRVAAAPQPFERVREEITERVVAAKALRAVEEYAGKLRSLSDVKVYLKAS